MNKEQIRKMLNLVVEQGYLDVVRNSQTFNESGLFMSRAWIPAPFAGDQEMVELGDERVAFSDVYKFLGGHAPLPLHKLEGDNITYLTNGGRWKVDPELAAGILNLLDHIDRGGRIPTGPAEAARMGLSARLF